MVNPRAGPLLRDVCVHLHVCACLLPGPPQVPSRSAGGLALPDRLRVVPQDPQEWRMCSLACYIVMNIH